MAAKKGKKIKVQDLKPKKDAKGGITFNNPGGNNPGFHGPGGNNPGFHGPGGHGPAGHGPAGN
jgi:hypothetical protein